MRETVPKISLCMIARDEAEMLPRCLDSVRGVVDEIVLVYTGSVDDTPRVAAEYGARVLRHEWHDHFADARNVSVIVPPVRASHNGPGCPCIEPGSTNSKCGSVRPTSIR